ncbi:unnamed protein product [Paramecium sonneborni]|uniref:Uncharacterized protein n=1 Tax=Paramecium sonneborni TaxID=65129 RepID=A0A8S1RKM3_9CILI|nr:unnamed protein product [Paramecium sonneborni]
MMKKVIKLEIGSNQIKTFLIKLNQLILENIKMGKNIINGIQYTEQVINKFSLRQEEDVMMKMDQRMVYGQIYKTTMINMLKQFLKASIKMEEKKLNGILSIKIKICLKFNKQQVVEFNTFKKQAGKSQYQIQQKLFKVYFHQ